MTKLIDLFDIRYGNQLDLNKLEVCENPSSGVNFVSRTGKNNGISAIVQRVKGVEPFKEGLISVALGGSILSSFVQPSPFYTGQNVMVLSSRKEMTLKEKLYYCLCIEQNKFRYSTFGREANRSLKDLVVPSTIPSWVYEIDIPKISDIKSSFNPIERYDLNTTAWRSFEYEELFDIQKGKRVTKRDQKIGNTPFISAISENNGVRTYIHLPPIHQGNTITVNYNGSIGEAFYQPVPFYASDDVNVLYPKFELNIFIAMFLITLIKKEQYRYSFGRKWHIDRMNSSIIKLPVKDNGTPDWEYMEKYIKTLQYSRKLSEYVVKES